MPGCWLPATCHHWESPGTSALWHQAKSKQPRGGQSQRVQLRTCPCSLASRHRRLSSRQRTPVLSTPCHLNTDRQTDKQRVQEHTANCLCKDLAGPSLHIGEGELRFNKNVHKSDSPKPGPHHFSRPTVGTPVSPRSIRLHASDLTRLRNPQARTRCWPSGPAWTPGLAALSPTAQEISQS